MGAEPQEARSLPRNRKCGNCRFYEPAPLWRKGWCRNPKLYPPHANHLVDATTIDCEGGFRSRIYWEPMPEPVRPEPAPPPPPAADPLPRINRNSAASQPVPVQPAIPFRERVRPPEASPFNMPPSQPPAQPFPANTHSFPADDFDQNFFDNEVVFTEPVRPNRQSRPAVPPPSSRPAPVAAALFTSEEENTGSDWRNNLRERLPFTRNWPLERLRLAPQQRLPLLIGLILVAALLFFVLPNLTKKSDPDLSGGTAALTTVTARPGTSVAPNSSLAAGAGLTTPLATPTPTKPPNRVGLVKGVGEGGLNMRSDATTKGTVLTKIKEGASVNIQEGPVDAEGRAWYKIEFEGKTGWVAKEFVELQT